MIIAALLTGTYFCPTNCKANLKIVAIKILTISHIKVMKLMLDGQLSVNTEIIRLAVPVQSICMQINGKIAIF